MYAYVQNFKHFKNDKGEITREENNNTFILLALAELGHPSTDNCIKCN